MSGLENLSSAPGSVGGIIRSAAERRPGWFHELVEWVETVTPGQGVARFTDFEGAHGGWSSLGTRRMVVSRARFRTIREEHRPLPFGHTTTQRKSDGFRARTTFPVFLDPPDRRAADLLQAAGCEGLKVGGARVAEWSINGIVATRVCTSADIAGLVRRMRDTVRDQSGVELETRLSFVDEDGNRFDP
jgi:UDP-N-acetylmuramate dehydrogenase